MDESILNRLTDIGLDQKEARIYIATLESGTAPASTIAKKAKLNRVTTYGLLQKLEGEGIILTLEKNEVAHFRAIEPDKLIKLTQERTKQLEKILPELNAIASETGIIVKQKLYEGLFGVKDAFKIMLESKTEILAFNTASEKTLWSEYEQEIENPRIQKQIFLRQLYLKDRNTKKLNKEDKESFRETKLITKKFALENEIRIFDDKVLIASFTGSPFALIIENKTISNTHKQIFESLWELT